MWPKQQSTQLLWPELYFERVHDNNEISSAHCETQSHSDLQTVIYHLYLIEYKVLL
jgi:hypothetical protein